MTESIAAEAFGPPFVARQPAVPEAVVGPPLAAQPAVSVPAALEVAAAVVVSALLLGLAADEGLPAGEAAPLAAAGVAVAVDAPVPLVHEPAAPGATVSQKKRVESQKLTQVARNIERIRTCCCWRAFCCRSFSCCSPSRFNIAAMLAPPVVTGGGGRAAGVGPSDGAA